ncbi:unnamed protein product [Allacma fusca]|uniref:Retrotransposon gag domain-containing protein n=1 Tax=Allacma fusca TaxID=39272 RepID=A0A8J2K7S1_9HEXA|nr:unnamed protein product [Allacma fusca]
MPRKIQVRSPALYRFFADSPDKAVKEWFGYQVPQIRLRKADSTKSSQSIWQWFSVNLCEKFCQEKRLEQKAADLENFKLKSNMSASSFVSELARPCWEIDPNMPKERVFRKAWPKIPACMRSIACTPSKTIEELIENLDGMLKDQEVNPWLKGAVTSSGSFTSQAPQLATSSVRALTSQGGCDYCNRSNHITIHCRDMHRDIANRQLDRLNALFEGRQVKGPLKGTNFNLPNSSYGTNPNISQGQPLQHQYNQRSNNDDGRTQPEARASSSHPGTLCPPPILPTPERIPDEVKKKEEYPRNSSRKREVPPEIREQSRMQLRSLPKIRRADEDSEPRSPDSGDSQSTQDEKLGRAFLRLWNLSYQRKQRTYLLRIMGYNMKLRSTVDTDFDPHRPLSYEFAIIEEMDSLLLLGENFNRRFLLDISTANNIIRIEGDAQISHTDSQVSEEEFRLGEVSSTVARLPSSSLYSPDYDEQFIPSRLDRVKQTETNHSRGDPNANCPHQNPEIRN